MLSKCRVPAWALFHMGFTSLSVSVCAVRIYLPKLMSLVAEPLPRETKVGGQGRGDVQTGAIHTPYTRLSRLQRLVLGSQSCPVYAEHAARCAFTQPSLISNVLPFKIFPAPFQLQDRVQIWTWPSLVTIQSSTGFFTLNDSTYSPLSGYCYLPSFSR